MSKAASDSAQQDKASSADRASTPISESRRRWPGSLPFALLGVAILVAVTLVLLAVRHTNEPSSPGSIRPTGIPTDVSTSLANLMSLTPIPRNPAPGFSLADQDGRRLSLNSFRGRVVVLEFMDPHCVDICPIVSQEFVDAYRDLGKTASRVVFVAVNVNQYHESVADVAKFSKEHGLDTISSWHFLTGSVRALKTVWRDYTVEVEAPNPNADIVHSSLVYFIDSRGQERYVGSPTDDHTKRGAAYLPAGQLASWGKGIAMVARDLAA